MASLAIAGFFILAVACGVGFGVASADSADELARAGAFGFDEATHASTLSAASAEGVSTQADADTGSSGQQVLASASARDISAGLAMVDQWGTEAKTRAAADAKAGSDRAEGKKAAQRTSSGGRVVSIEASAIDPAVDPAALTGELREYDLPAVDWSVGKAAFIEEWTGRINAYLAGKPLAGHGAAFAEAAWENGIDPRWSPAISNTESGNGTNCFLPYNAWGWGDDAWPDWDTAIREHVAGLATGYGYSLTYASAQKYCPPNSIHWYNNTLGQMALI